MKAGNLRGGQMESSGPNNNGTQGSLGEAQLP